jgi:hypothetical protein
MMQRILNGLHVLTVCHQQSSVWTEPFNYEWSQLKGSVYTPRRFALDRQLPGIRIRYVRFPGGVHFLDYLKGSQAATIEADASPFSVLNTAPPKGFQSASPF